jgi:predicted peptidase
VLVFLHAQHAKLDGDISLFFESEAPPQLVLGSHQCPEALRKEFVLICPQCPRDLSQMYGSGVWLYSDWYGKRTFMPEVESDLAALVELAVQHPLLDQDFVTMTGTSMGALGCLEFASRRPGLFKACVPVAAHYEMDLDALVERLTKEQELPLWFFHAPEDTLCPCERIDALVGKLKARSRAEVRFTRYRDFWSKNGHCADRVSYHIVSRDEGQDAIGDEVFAWILKHRRSVDGD